MQEADQMIMQMERQVAVEMNKAKEKLKKAVNPMTYLHYYDNYNRIKGRILKIKRWLNNPNGNVNTAQQGLDDIRFKFTGKHTDIANISRYENGRMSVSELDNIADNSIKNAVKQEFSIAEKQGYIKQVNVDNNQFFELTPKGKEHINSAEFVKQFEHNQIESIVNSDVNIGKPISFRDTIEMTSSGQIIEQPIFVCERSTPDRYMEISSHELIDESTGNPFVSTEYKVFNNGQQQKCSEFSHGKFTHYTDFQGENTSCYGVDHWGNMQSEMLEKGGFSDDMLLFQNKTLYEAYVKRFSKQQAVKNDFTGKHTDIANMFYENGRMSVSELDNIADNNIKSAVKQEFSIAEKQGYIKQVNVDNNQFFELTPKGKEHINSAEFVKQFEHNQIDSVVKSNPRAVVNFQGNADDMNIFRYTDKVNINNSSAKVQNYFQRCSPKFVSIENGIATPTDTLKNMLVKSPTDKLVQNGNIKMVTSDNIEKLMQASKTAAKEGAKTAAKEGAKTAAKEGAKTAAKVAAQKGATVAAGTAAGAATAGIGTVVVVAVEKAAELAKKIEEAKNKVKNELKQTTQQMMK